MRLHLDRSRESGARSGRLDSVSDDGLQAGEVRPVDNTGARLGLERSERGVLGSRDLATDGKAWNLNDTVLDQAAHIEVPVKTP